MLNGATSYPDPDEELEDEFEDDESQEEQELEEELETCESEDKAYQAYQDSREPKYEHENKLNPPPIYDDY